MSSNLHRQITSLEELRLPELQRRFAEVIGEETRCPNRTHLIHRITEALQAGHDENRTGDEASSEATPTDHNVEAEHAHDNTSLTKLTVQELQARYFEVVGRPTGSSNRRYLIWKIRQAEKGLVTVGPRNRRCSEDPPPEYKVLPLRLEADMVARLDEVRERQGIKSRMELFRRSLHAYLASIGESEVAALFAPEA